MHRLAPVSQRLEALGPIAGLGLSLKPPQWARDLVSSVVKGVRVQFDPGTGMPIEVDTSDPEQLKKLAQIIQSTRASVSFGGQPSPVAVPFGATSIPWGTIAIGAAAIGAVLLLSRRRRVRA